MKFSAILAAAALCCAAIGPALAQTPAAAVAGAAQAAPTKFSTETKIGALMAEPAAKAVLEKYIPQVVAHPQIGEASEMTLPELTQYVPELTAEMLAKINADLGKL